LSNNNLDSIRNEEFTNRGNAVDRLSLRDELRAIEKGRATSAWYNPAKSWEKAENGIRVRPQTIYVGENGPSSPLWTEPVFDMAKFQNNEKALKSGSTNDIYAVLEDPYIGEWASIAREYADAIKNNRLKSASIGTDADFSAIDVINVMTTMVNTELRTFVLEQALTTIGTPQLDLKVDTYTRFQAEQGVPEGVQPIPKRGSVSRTSYDLTKDVGLIGITDEAQLRTVHDLYSQQVDTAVTDFKRIKSNKIATLISTFPSTSGSNWGSFTTDHNTNSPFTDIGAVTDTIFANNGAPNVMASADKTFRTYVQSTYVKGVLQAIPLPDMSVAKIINQVPGLPGMQWFVDNEMTNTTVGVFDKKAVALLQGPIRSAQYRLELEGIDGYIYRDWNLPINMIPGRTSLLTGVNS
jgi:hypothetical protein